MRIFDRYVRDRSCQGCKFAGSDPDGGYCALPKSLEVSSGFGRSWDAARRDPEICNNGEKFVPMDHDRAKALGIMQEIVEPRTETAPYVRSRPAYQAAHTEHEEIMREICGFSGAQD